METTSTPKDTPHAAWSYERHRDHEREEVNWPSCYTRPGSIDAWRHRRMHDTLLPMLEAVPGARWLTIGDGNFASDAHYLMRKGAEAVASSISDATLAPALEKGYIKAFQVENAEALSPSDGAFDFVLCKESYHHFPRPPIAFYEMLRVAKVGVVLIEPCDGPQRPLDRLKTFIKRVIRKDDSVLFETSGNFIFRVDVAEVRKMMTALNHRCVAHKPFNDFFHPRISGGEYGKDRIKTFLSRLGIGVQDLLSSLRLMNPGLGTVIALKDDPTPSLRRALEKAGYRVHDLPRNPYLAT